MSQLKPDEVVGAFLKSVNEGRTLRLDLMADGVLAEGETLSGIQESGSTSPTWSGTYELRDDCTLVTQIGPYRTVYVPGELPGVYYGVETRHDDQDYRACVHLIRMRI